MNIKICVHIIFYNCKQMYSLFQEDILYDCHKWIKNYDYHKLYDSTWVIPNCKNDIEFYNIIFKKPTKIIPYIWNHSIIQYYNGLYIHQPFLE